MTQLPPPPHPSLVVRPSCGEGAVSMTDYMRLAGVGVVRTSLDGPMLRAFDGRCRLPSALLARQRCWELCGRPG